MAFETIERIGPQQAAICPRDGLRLRTCRAPKAKPGRLGRFITLEIGQKLAASLVFRGEVTAVDVALGTGLQKGWLALGVNPEHGAFPAKRKPDGGYRVNINEASAAGLFSLTFAPFTVMGSAIKMIEERNVPPRASFKLPVPVLALADA
jgi:hypothetical protein